MTTQEFKLQLGSSKFLLLNSDEPWKRFEYRLSQHFWVKQQQERYFVLRKRVYQMVRESTTNQFTMLILEISMSEPLRLDLQAQGLLFSNFANT